MQSIGPLLASIALQFYLVDCLSNSLAYVVSAMQHFNHVQPDIFNCIFLNIHNGAYPDDEFAELVQYGMLISVTNYVINSEVRLKFSDFPQKPSLIIAYVTRQKLLKHIIDLLWIIFRFFDPNTRVMVLMSLADSSNALSISMILSELRFNYVVYISTNQPSMVVQLDFKGLATVIKGPFPHPSQLFHNAVRNMGGSAFHYATFSQLTSVNYKWMLAAAKLLNATAKRIDIACSTNEMQKCMQYVVNNVDIAVAKIGIMQIPPGCHRWISDVMPDSEVILVPKGRRLNMAEMFKEPFNYDTWCVLLIVVILVEVISLLYPTLFKDDPILLLLCGYDRFNLHRARGHQRLIYMPLIAFFFVMSNAYGPKIISILADKPAVPDVLSIQQLIESGIKIKANLNDEPYLLEDKQLASVLVNSSDHILHLDGVHAYIGRSFRQAEVLIQLPTSYDYILQRPKYTILEEQRGLRLLWFMIGFRTPLREVFYYTQKALFESGILGHWFRLLYAEVNAELRAEYREMIIDDLLGWLRFSDLIPAWIALAVGLMLSMVMFAGEIFSITVLRIIKTIIEMIQKFWMRLLNAVEGL